MPSCFRLLSILALATGLTASAATLVAQAPAPSSETVPAETGGPITITPVGHATLQISHDGLWIDVDPTAARAAVSLHAPDIILITDVHGDHLSAETIGSLRGASTTVIGPAAVAEQVQDLTTLANGASTTVRGAMIEAVPMYNLERGPSPGELFHTVGRGNGYVITLGGTRIYVAGDTECTPEMRALEDIDVAFLPMNLPYTMTPAEAAECARAFSPGIVYPYHYRGQDPALFQSALQGTGIEVRLRDAWWYPETPGDGGQGGRGGGRGGQ